MGTDINDVALYWDASPCNSRRGGAHRVASREWFDAITANKRRVEPHGEAFADFPSWAGKFVLDVGCGLGTDTVAFADHGAAVAGIDISQRSLDLALENLTRHGLRDRAVLLRRNMEELDADTPLHGADLIWAFGTIHHTPHPKRALIALRRLAGENTTLRVMLYHRRSWKWVVEMRGRSAESEAAGGCPVTYAYSRGQARRLVESAGWRVTSLRTEFIFPYRVEDYIAGRYVRKLGWRLMPRWMFRALERTVGWNLLISAVPKGAGR